MGAEGWDRATELVREHGAWAVVVARFLPVVRAMVPPVAGASRMPYRVFAPASLAGAAVQSAVLVTAGTLAGEAVVTAWPQVQDRLGTVAVVVLGGGGDRGRAGAAAGRLAPGQRGAPAVGYRGRSGDRAGTRPRDRSRCGCGGRRTGGACGGRRTGRA